MKLSRGEKETLRKKIRSIYQWIDKRLYGEGAASKGRFDEAWTRLSLLPNAAFAKCENAIEALNLARQTLIDRSDYFNAALTQKIILDEGLKRIEALREVYQVRESDRFEDTVLQKLENLEASVKVLTERQDKIVLQLGTIGSALKHDVARKFDMPNVIPLTERLSALETQIETISQLLKEKNLSPDTHDKITAMEKRLNAIQAHQEEDHSAEITSRRLDVIVRALAEIKQSLAAIEADTEIAEASKKKKRLGFLKS